MNFNEFRKEKGISVKALSELSGIPIGTINAWCAGQREISRICDCVALAKAMDCRFEDLLDGDLRRDYIMLMTRDAIAEAEVKPDGHISDPNIAIPADQNINASADDLRASMDALRASIDTLNGLLQEDINTQEAKV